MRITLREAVATDAHALIDHLARLAAEPDVDVPLEPGEFEPTVEEERRTIAEYAASENSVFLVAQVDGELAGVLTLRGGRRLASRHRADLGMAVERRWRGRGIGRRLLDRAISFARESRLLTRIGLEVYARNAVGVHLYETAGFRREGIRRGAVRESAKPVDSLVMGRLLGGKRPVPFDEPPAADGPWPGPSPGAGVEIRVRPARVEDATPLVALARALQREPGAAAPAAAEKTGRSEAEERRAIEAHASQETWVQYVATAAGRVIGTVNARGGSRRALRHVAACGLGVARPWRRRGVARTLLEYLLAWADGNDAIHRLEVNAYSDNLPAIAICGRFGFQVEGCRRRAYFHGGRYHDDFFLARLS